MSKHEPPVPPAIVPEVAPEVVPTHASIQQQIESGIQAGVAAAMARMGVTQPNMNPSPDEKHAEAIKMSKPRLLHQHTLVPYISREPMGTGAAMLLVVSHRGRVVNMQRYTHPEGYDKICPKGRDPGPAGRLPEGCTMTVKAANGERPNLRTQHLIYQTYYVRDIGLLLGRKLFEAGRMTDEEKVEWLKVNPLILTPENGVSSIGSEPVSDEEDAAE